VNDREQIISGGITWGKTMKRLKNPFISEGIVPILPDDDMIQDSNIQQNSTIPDLLGDLIVGFARLAVAAGMVVT